MTRSCFVAGFGAPNTARKPVDQLVRPEHSPRGPALAVPRKAPVSCPMIRHLRAMGAPLFEDQKPRLHPIPSAPPAFRRKL